MMVYGKIELSIFETVRRVMRVKKVDGWIKCGLMRLLVKSLC